MTPRVLLVDDDPALRRALVRLLSLGADVTVVESRERAEQQLALHEAGHETGAFDVVLSDVDLGGDDGLALAAHVQRAHPALYERFVLMTCEPEGGRFAEALETLGRPVLRKPFTAAEFFELAERLLSPATATIGSPATATGD
ncbi:MAG: response regulator [Deltaproteobacteria bacterium]|nr:response regulator [Deltaproteobacteria bacterium]